MTPNWFGQVEIPFFSYCKDANFVDYELALRKFENFSAIQILRETNFGVMQTPKIVNLEAALEFDFETLNVQ